MATALAWRFGVLAVFASSALACGGDVGEGAGAGTGGGGAVAIPCASPQDATIDFEQTCGSFIPALFPSEVTYVERTTVGAMQAHRFRATSDCGFDVVVSLPALAFAADAEPYEMSTWWIQGVDPLGLLAVIFRRSGDRAPLLAVAAEGNVDLMNGLLDPYAVTLDGPACVDSPDLVQPILTRDEAPLSCADESPGVRLCHDGDVAYRVVDYVGPPGSVDVAAVMGDAELLAPAP